MDIEKIVRSCIDNSLHMSLATVSDNKPWVCEVHFVYDDELNLYWRSKADRRHSWDISGNPHVAGNIVKQVGPGEPCAGAIYFEGTAEQVHDPAVQQAVAPLFVKRLGSPDTILEEVAKHDGNKIYKLTVSNWAAFGDFDGTGLKKHEAS